MRADFFPPALFAVFALISGNGFCADDAVPSRDKFEHADYIVFSEVERVEAGPEVVIVKMLESFKRPPGAAAPARARVFLGQSDGLAQPAVGARWILFLTPRAGAAAGDGLVALRVADRRSDVIPESPAVLDALRRYKKEWDAGEWGH